MSETICLCKLSVMVSKRVVFWVTKEWFIIFIYNRVVTGLILLTNKRTALDERDDQSEDSIILRGSLELKQQSENNCP